MTKVPLTSLRSYLFSPVYYSAFSFFAMRRIGSHPANLFPKHSFGCSVGKMQRAIETVNQVDTSLRLKLKTVRLLWFVRNMIYAKGRARNSSGHKGDVSPFPDSNNSSSPASSSLLWRREKLLVELLWSPLCHISRTISRLCVVLLLFFALPLWRWGLALLLFARLCFWARRAPFSNTRFWNDSFRINAEKTTSLVI